MDYSIFEDMELNPFAVPKGQTMDYYRTFMQKRFWEKPDGLDWSKEEIDGLIRFTVLLVDPQSPFYEEKNMELRVDKCKSALGMKQSDRFLTQYMGGDVDKMKRVISEIDGMGMVLSNLIFEIFKTLNDHLFETWFSMKMNLHRMNNYLRAAPVPDKNGSIANDINSRRLLSESMSELTYELIEIEYQLFPNDRLAKIINERSTDDGLGGYAEQYAENPDYGG